MANLDLERSLLSPMTSYRPAVGFTTEEAIETTKSFGRYQLMAVVIANLIWFPTNILLTAVPYMQRRPTFECLDSDNSTWSSCSEQEACDTTFRVTPDSPSSMIIDFNLYCDRAMLIGLVGSAYFVGCLVGLALFSTMSDTRGRKYTLQRILPFEPILALLFVFSTSAEMLIVVQFLCGMLLCPASMTAFVWATEFMGVKHSNIVATSLNAIYAVVSMLSPLTLLVAENWREMGYLLVIASSLAALSLFWMDESPRSLIGTLKNYDQARTVFSRMAKMNGRNCQFDFLFRPEIEENQQKQGSMALQGDDEESTDDVQEEKGGLIILATNRDARKTTWVTIFIWFAVALCFFGIEFSIPLLSTGVITSGFVLSIVEIISVSSSAFLQDRYGRKLTMRAFLAMAGFALPALFLFSSGTLSLVVLCIAKFGAASAFNNIYVYTAELFPTFLRNTAVGAGATSSRMGGMMAPMLVLVFSRLGMNPLVFFGLFAFVATFSVSALPETRGRGLPVTIEDMKFQHCDDVDSSCKIDSTNAFR